MPRNNCIRNTCRRGTGWNLSGPIPVLWKSGFRSSGARSIPEIINSTASEGLSDIEYRRMVPGYPPVGWTIPSRKAIPSVQRIRHTFLIRQVASVRILQGLRGGARCIYRIHFSCIRYYHSRSLKNGMAAHRQSLLQGDHYLVFAYGTTPRFAGFHFRLYPNP